MRFPRECFCVLGDTGIVFVKGTRCVGFRVSTYGGFVLWRAYLLGFSFFSGCKKLQACAVSGLGWHNVNDFGACLVFLGGLE